MFAVEALHLASLLCQYGYFFPVGEAKTLQVKDDSSLYRFQASIAPTSSVIELSPGAGCGGRKV